MRGWKLLGLLGLASVGHAVLPKFDHDANDYYVIHLDEATTPAQMALRLGMVHEGCMGELTDHHIFRARKEGHDVVKRAVQEHRLRTRGVGNASSEPLDGVLFSEKLKLRRPWQKRVVLPDPNAAEAPALEARQDPVEWAVEKQRKIAETLGIHDPIFHEQWHLINTVQVGHDINVTDVWLQGITGHNATVAIVDDGLDMYSEDLKDNYYAAGSYDFNDHTSEPRPRLSDDRHGTRCAGEVAAVKNNVCGVGVAWNAKVSGLRILSKLITDADEAVAMTYDFQHNHIYSCSWGPPDDGKAMDAPGILIKRAMLKAVQQGRGGLGSIYVFASGNGAAFEDNCNFDGYTNSIYSITVGAVDRKGQHPYYSEKCSAQLVVTYSSGSGDAIHTTDVGANACYSGHGGTSAAAPLAAGIFALVLQVRPDISWRDMQYLAMESAVPIELPGDDVQTTSIGKKFSHTFGYGKVDSWGIVELAKTWKKVKPQAWFYSPWIHVNQPIPQGDKGIAVEFEVTADMLKEANLERIEHVTVTMNVEHSKRGDLSVDLVSPHGIVSHLSTTRKLDNSNAGYADWTFMSVVHWGEPGVGKWTIIVKDTKVDEHTGTFIDWHLKLWGECIDPAKAKVLPMPNEDDDKDHASIATTTLPVTTVTVAPDPNQKTTAPLANPTDHPDRPQKVRPSTTSSSQPTPPPASATDGVPAAATTTPANSSWLPGFLPTFGVSSRTQAWIYGALGLVVAFCCGLGLWLWLARRRRLRNAGITGGGRDDYEFELLEEDDEAEGLTTGEKAGGKRKRGKKTRGGELYDAFAGGSDDDLDLDSTVDGSDDDGDYGGGNGRGRGAYRDDVPGASGSGSGSASGGSNGPKGRRRLSLDSQEDNPRHVVGDDEDEEEDDEAVTRREVQEQGDRLLGRRT